MVGLIARKWQSLALIPGQVPKPHALPSLPCCLSAAGEESPAWASGDGNSKDGGGVALAPGTHSPFLPPDRGEDPGGQGAAGAVFRPWALVLDPSALARGLGAHHGPADLYRPGFTSTPGHLVSPQGRRGGVLTLHPGSGPQGSLECDFLTHHLPARGLVPSPQVPAALEKPQTHSLELCPPQTEQQLLGKLQRGYS